MVQQKTIRTRDIMSCCLCFTSITEHKKWIFEEKTMSYNQIENSVEI